MSERPFTLAVASGKGGTGKTMVATSLAYIAASAGTRVTLADCDVEAPNAHLFLRPDEARMHVADVEVSIAAVEPKSCIACGACRDACAFGAIRVLGDTAIVFDELCHGCGLCADICPTRAITEVSVRVGETRSAPVAGLERLSLVSGELDIGQVKSPTVIRAVRSLAQKSAAPLTLLDAPPGVACSAVAATRGAHALLLVTEPTPFGVHDLELSFRLGRELGLPMGVVINRAGNGAESVAQELCAHWEIPVVARIPFDRRIAAAYARGELPVRSVEAVATALSPVVDQMQALASDRLARVV